jgi:hypothetical protein
VKIPLISVIERDTLVLARGHLQRRSVVDRDSLAMHPASLPSPHAAHTRSLARVPLAMHPALPSREAVNIRDSLAMHPASVPLRDKQLPPDGEGCVT